jgi:hypothetical protein
LTAFEEIEVPSIVMEVTHYESEICVGDLADSTVRQVVSEADEWKTAPQIPKRFLDHAEAAVDRGRILLAHPCACEERLIEERQVLQRFQAVPSAGVFWRALCPARVVVDER